MKIEILEPGYNKNNFYSVMGKYFAEERYRKEMPYLSNNEHKIWFIYSIDNNIAGFASIMPHKSHYSFNNSYVLEEYRKNGIWIKLIDDRLSYLNGKLKIIKITVKEKFQVDYLIKLGFTIVKTTKNYTFMELEK